MPTNITCSRRRFLGTTTAAWATVSIAPGSIFGAASPNAKLNLAGIGVGGVGFGQLDACEKAGFQIACLCDVDQVYAKKAFDK